MFEIKYIILITFFIINIKLYLSEKHVAVMTEEKNRFTLTARPGDTIEYICPYNLEVEMNDEKAEDSEYIDNEEFCFEYIVTHKNVFRLEDRIRGVYNIVKTNPNHIYKGQFTLPPIVLSNRSFECYCYMGPNENVVKKVLRVNIIHSRVHKIPGCDFTSYNKSNSITTEIIEDINQKNVCDIYPKSGDYIGLLCPENYSAKPDGCFTNVYVMKDGHDLKSEKDVNNRLWEADKFKAVNISTILKVNLVTSGDEKYKFAQIPNVQIEASFSCICKSNNKPINLMMNVHLNKISKVVDSVITHKTVSKISNTTTVEETPKKKGQSSCNKLKLFLFIFLLLFSFFS